MNKFIAISLLLSLASVKAFAPNPAFGARQQVSLSLFGRGNNAAVLEPEAKVLEKETVEESLADATANVMVAEEIAVEEDMNEAQKMMQQVKDAGVAGVISYALWELGFWTVSVPVCMVGYREVTGHWPDLSDSQDLEQLGAEAFAFVNFARFAVPLRIGLALGTTPWIQNNVVDRFMKKGDEKYDPAVDEV